ncbi:hypothetical protein QFX17_07140 [Lactobacillus helveticus]|uniref:hypothetical protein n=1 Tax=Lactobacillus helveticus TaxID=1587 RepID=UPI001563F7C0|nr:hypothetical protein [Lactobacillus helveticus]MCP9317190.1 hypothetical protein [Lactobacillus helveticus]MDH5817999.1 hypothetical protein [Lactobacillus helveticus]MDN6023978.1 hypothetical protein [Lactobacillus sp.]
MWIILVINLLVAMAIAYFGLKERQEDFNLCNENKQLGERTKNTAPSIDEGMNLVFLLLFCLILFL